MWTGTSWPRPVPWVWSRRPAATTSPAGVPFDRFAAQRIRGAILDAVRAADWAPRSVRTLARKLEAVEQRLATELGRVPSRAEMAEALGMTPRRAAPAAGPHVPLRRARPRVRGQRRPTRTSPWSTCSPTASAVEPLEELESRELLPTCATPSHLLPERHRLVVVGYFLEGRTSQELARFLGVTESRVSQLRSEALGCCGKASRRSTPPGRPTPEPIGRVARRKAGYASAIAEASPWQERVSA